MASDLRLHPQPAAKPERLAPVASLDDADYTAMRLPVYRPKKRRWPGLLLALLVAAAVGGLVVSNYYEDRTMGQRLDDTVGATQQSMRSEADVVRDSVAQAAEKGTQATDRVANTLGDAGISAAVKTAPAADPALRALQSTSPRATAW
jgi:hyperosmotically inducible periplasmic protein